LDFEARDLQFLTGIVEQIQHTTDWYYSLHFDVHQGSRAHGGAKFLEIGIGPHGQPWPESMIEAE